MREIKFRVWTGQEMLYINPREELQLNIGINDGWALWDVEGEICSHEKGELMQYTGLKDKNGKEIYEGDVVKGKRFAGKGEHVRFIGEVLYRISSFRVDGVSKYKGHCGEDLHGAFEVIGNIYENPELLEAL